MLDSHTIRFSAFYVGAIGLCLLISACTQIGNTQKNNPAMKATPAQSSEQFLVGTYTADGSEGVYLIELDENANKLRNLGVIAKGINPSYLAMSADKKQLFAASGDQNASITRYDFNTTAQQFDLTQVIQASGNGACHIAINPETTFAAISNYGSAEVHLFELDAQNTSIKLKSTFKNAGTSINKARQEAAHMHYSQWDNHGKFLYSVDLGTDEILVFDTTQQEFHPIHRVNLSPGDGPRHLAFHPTLPFVYSNNELSNTITVFKQNQHHGKLSEVQRVNLLDGSELGSQYASAIKISADGRFLYSAVRGVNKINAYSIDAKGKLNFISSESITGNWPRDFSISASGNFILVANQFSNTVSVLKRDTKTGKLTSTDMSVEISSPSFVAPYF